jgi:hypothetical protein
MGLVPVSLGSYDGQRGGVNLYKSDTIFFLGLNNAILIKELCHC